MKNTTIFLFCLILSVSAENFKVSDHPAKLIRTITGFTEPSATLMIEAEFSARVDAIHVNEGQILKADNGKDLLISQDSILAKIALQKEEAALKSESQVLKKLASEKAIAEREVKYRLLEKKRFSKLSESGKATKASSDMAEFEYDKSLLKVKDIETAILVQKQVINERKVAKAKAEEDLSRHKLYGPSGWTVNERFIEAGSLVSPGEKVIQLLDLRTLSVYFRLSEMEIDALQKGEIEIYAKATGHKVSARIHRIDLTFDPVSRKRLVELRLPGKEFTTPSGGLEVELKLAVPYPNPAVKIPTNYVFNKLEQDYVRLSDGNIVALNPLRKNSDSVVISLKDLPKNAELVLPGKK